MKEFTSYSEEFLDKPLVSVIIPAFNAAADIRQTLGSVVAQTYRAIEVIVVDDGSSDATTAIVDEFVTTDSRFQLVRQSNAGVFQRFLHLKMNKAEFRTVEKKRKTK